MATQRESLPAEGESARTELSSGKAIAAKFGTGGLVVTLMLSGSLPMAIFIAGGLLLAVMAVVTLVLWKRDAWMYERLLCLLGTVFDRGQVVTHFVSILRDTEHADRLLSKTTSSESTHEL
ncbi:hypothetical protein [Nonomuraea solani]|uniref:hypothetical protein n=1 Tax=Nonomuraea solani TaxID=1144553 RepID=UPI000CDEC1BD|nr:hypothetical protein [Nonomuraea solani]